jgi:hypothetical protein
MPESLAHFTVKIDLLRPKAAPFFNLLAAYLGNWLGPSVIKVTEQGAQISHFADHMFCECVVRLDLRIGKKHKLSIKHGKCRLLGFIT